MIKKTFMIIGIIILSAIPFFSISSRHVTAYDDDNTALRQKIIELENRINDLEKLIKNSGEPNNIQPAPGPGWQNKKNWRSLKAGMTKQDVHEILGEPIKTIDGVRTLWYYPNIYCGYVSFDENGCLTGWNEPLDPTNIIDRFI